MLSPRPSLVLILPFSSQLHVRGGGALDGSDLRTQQKIGEMSGIVKKLIEQFGESFNIRKMMRRNDGQWTSHERAISCGMAALPTLACRIVKGVA
jgi:hypothetical protein